MDSRTGTFVALIALLGGVGFLLVAPLLQYVLAAGLLAFVLHPVHRQIVASTPYLGPRLSGVVLTGVALVAAIVPIMLLTLVLFDTALSLSQGFSREDIQSLLETLRQVAIDLGIDPTYVAAAEAQLTAEVTQALSSATQILLTRLVDLLGTTVQTSFGVMITLFLLYYFLVDGEAFLGWLHSVSPIESTTLDELFAEISTVTWAVVGSHLLVAVVEAVAGGIGFWIIGVPNPAFWMVVMFVLSVLPLVGVALVWVPALGWVLAAGRVGAALFLLGYGLVMLVLLDSYLRALFVDHSTGLHPAVVLVGVLGGIYLLGVIGLFLGPVLLAVLKASIVVFARVERG